MTCKNCCKEKTIVNKHFCLCLECNNRRLRELKPKNYTSISQKNKTSLKRPKKTIYNYSFIKPMVKKKTSIEKIKEDEIFYKKCFDNSDHKCEECNKELPDTFLNDDNKVNARWRYSHIVPKSIAPELRHNLLNINHLCLIHHMQWENGDKENMEIYLKNKARLPNYF